jgi:two-component system, NtrC family, response regulator HydG
MEKAAPLPTALIVDDDANFRRSLEVLVQREGFTTRAGGSLEEARKSLAEDVPDVVLLDLTLPDGDGLAWFRSEDSAAQVELIVITGGGSIDSAISAMRGGALDYLTKPIDRARLTTALLNLARTRALKEEVGTLRSDLRELGRFGAMVGRSKPMLEVYDLIARVAPTDATVLVTGESGTGKELVAETIHRLSPRRSRVLVPVNCGAVSANLIESELFGHERGSFTGADRLQRGYFEQANGGTLFLDEVSETPPDLQVKLLRVLETGTLVRVGGSGPIHVNVRVVAATNRNPEEAVRAGKLREDLYYRLNVFPITVPPLRNRPGDVELLAEHFLHELDRASGTERRWSDGALEQLAERPWTGNVRELRNAVQRAFILGADEISVDAAPIAPSNGSRTTSTSLELKVGTSIADAERSLILATLASRGGNKREAAVVLGISLKTLYSRLGVYNAANGSPPRADSD